MKKSAIALAALAAFSVPASAQAVGRHILLDEGAKAAGLVRFYSQAIELADGAKQSWVTITRTGDFSDPRYGDFKITPTHLDQMVANFNNRVMGQDVFLDVAHRPNDGAAGKFLKLAVEGGRLRGLVEWTDFGIDAVKKRGFAYLSAEYHENWKDNEQQQAHGCVLLGAGLTTRPVIKNLDPVTLGESDGDHDSEMRVAISPSLLRELTKQLSSEPDMNKHLLALVAALTAIGFKAEAEQKPFITLATPQLEAVKDDEAKCLAVVDAVKAAAQSAMDQIKKLAQPGDGTPHNITITLAAPGAAIDPATLAAEVTKQLAAAATAAATAQTTLTAKLKLLSDTLAEDKSLTPEGVVKLAADVAPMISAATSDENVKALAALQLKNWNAQTAATKLATLGFRPASGNVQISVDSGNGIKALQVEVDKRLGLTETKDSRRFERTGGELLKGNAAFAEKVLAEFDAANAEQLLREHKHLAAGTGSVSDVAVPVIAERTVIREQLYDLMTLPLMDVNTAPMANVITIPYSYRDRGAGAAGVANLRRYEGQGIRRAGVIQTIEETRPIPQKLAFLLSAEMQMLVGASVINWDPIAENMRNMIRIVGEDTEALNLNNMAQSCDEYGAVAVVAEDLGVPVDGANTIFALAQFPVCKPRKVYDLKGVQVGATVNPIVVTYKGGVIAEYLLPADGSALGAGNYYVMNYNLGELHIVTEAGVVVVPAAADTLTVSYYYATNVKKFNTDPGAVATDVFWDTLLFAIGGRKAVIEDDRFYTANMILMSGNVNNQLSQAKTFQANSARIATGLASDGAVGIVKDMPVWRPRAPGTLFGDTRVMVGMRGCCRFRMIKPWSVEPLQPARDANGLFTDSKETYGTQWVGSHTPTQLKASMSCVILYSAAGRVSRVA
ncbi:phage protease [Aquabacterium sp.]|uniref:phage protease n=1 Tax=Aquabacterium sp. TaxID=1872578 RepID=UPI0025B8FF88|nr:phage protease [Aquabacterium sp.]